MADEEVQAEDAALVQSTVLENENQSLENSREASPTHSSNSEPQLQDKNQIGELTEEDIVMLSLEKTDKRAVASARLLSQNAVKAKFSRASFARSDTLSSSDSGDERGERNVLITELQDNGDYDQNQEEGLSLQDIKSEKLSSSYSLKFEENSEDWDTDLEIEDEVEEHDPTGRSLYNAMCEKLGIVPVSYFVRHITEPEITMRYHGLGPQGTRAIARVLKENITLEKLNLSGNWMSAEGGFHMARTLNENDYITELNLSYNKLGPMGAYHLSKVLLVNTGLRKLDLSGNEFGDGEAQWLAEAIEHNKSLKDLNLSNNLFGAAAGEILGQAIGSNDILERLDLSWNQLRQGGAIAIARGIKENIRLKSCNISWNGFGPDSGPAVAEIISNNQGALEELDISGNRLDTGAAVLIAKALKGNEELKRLMMGTNPISTAGAIALISVINESQTCVLEYLDLIEVPVEFEYLRVVDEIKKRKTFEERHGMPLRSGNTPDDIGKRSIDPNMKEPLIILSEHIVVNDLRIVDLLKDRDPENVLSVTPDQFASALEELKVPYTHEQIQELSRRLDKKNDGRIYYGDIMAQAQAQSHLRKEKSTLRTPSAQSHTSQGRS